MTAYRMWGKQEYYDDHQNLAYRQYWDPAVWLQYNVCFIICKIYTNYCKEYKKQENIFVSHFSIL